VHNELALAFLRSGERDRAAHQLDGVLAWLDKPDRQFAERDLFDVLAEIGDDALIDRAIRIIDPSAPKGVIRLAILAGSLARFRHRERAADLARRLLDLPAPPQLPNPYAPSAPLAWPPSHVIEAVGSAGDDQAVAELIDRIRAMPVIPARVEAGVTLTKTLAARKRPNDAILVAEEVMGWTLPQDTSMSATRTFGELGGVFASGGRCERALEMFTRALAAAQTAGAPPALSALANVTSCLAGKPETLAAMCEIITDVRGWWPERGSAGERSTQGGGF
jgi:hypothetical protein